MSTPPQETMTLLISCPDQPGIVAAVAHFIFQQHGNIVQSDQYSTDPHDGTFFMRISFVADRVVLSEAELIAQFTPIAHQFQMEWQVCSSRQRKRAGVLVSKLDHCLIDLLWRWKRQELAIEIPWIISNHPDLAPVAKMYGLPYHYIPIRQETRRSAHLRLLELVSGTVDFLILARYMQILEPEFITAYPQRLINIHHSFLPAFRGARPYQQAFERGVKLIGATAHYVTEQLDEGPIITQDVIHCTHRDTPLDLVRKGRDVERRVLAEAVRLHVEDRIIVHKKRTVVF